jgi:hypothetical protein
VCVMRASGRDRRRPAVRRDRPALVEDQRAQEINGPIGLMQVRGHEVGMAIELAVRDFDAVELDVDGARVAALASVACTRRHIDRAGNVTAGTGTVEVRAHSLPTNKRFCSLCFVMAAPCFGAIACWSVARSASTSAGYRLESKRCTVSWSRQADRSHSLYDRGRSTY